MPELPPHDIRGTLWWVVERVANRELAAPDAQAINAAVRILATIGEEDVDDALAWRMISLKGRAMNGLPPRDAAEWDLARQYASPEAFSDMVAAGRLLERDVGGAIQPVHLDKVGAGDGDLPAFAEYEDGGLPAIGKWRSQEP